MRYLVLLLLFAPLLAAQDSEPISGTVPGNRRLNYLLRAEFGGATTSFSLAANFNTSSSQGLIVRLIDLDAVSGSGALNPPGFDESIVPGAGTANASLAGSYSGRREFALEIESNGSGSTFSGSITSSAGSLELVASDQLVVSATGLRTAVGRMAFFSGTTSPGASTSSSFQLDLGPVSRTVFVRFDAAASGVDKVELIENTGGSATILATFTTFPDATAVPITGSGVRTLRVNARGATGVSGGYSWGVTAPTEVAVDRVQSGGGSSNDDDGSCTTNPAAGWPGIMALLPALALLARRRPKTGPSLLNWAAHGRVEL